MKKFFLTIGFLSALSFKGLASTTATDELRRELSEQISARVSSSKLVRSLALRVPEEDDLFARFQTVFHNSIEEFIAVTLEILPLGKVAGINAGNFIEKLWEIQESRNTEAAAKAAVAADAAKQRRLLGLGSSFRGLGLEEVSEHAEYLDADLKVQSANVARVEGNIEATTAALSDLGGQENAYREANALVSNVAKWGKSHELDADITDPVTAATAWVARRQGRFDTDQRNKDKKDKLALAKSVLILVQDATTAEAMGAKTAAYNDQISEITARLAALKDELRVAKTDLKKAESLSATAASRVKALTPKGASTPTTGGGEGFAGTPPSGK